MKHTIAAFDFDGTITRKDTFWEFIKKTHSPLQIAWNFLLLFPVLVLYKTGFLENGKSKQIVFSRFYKNWPLQAFNEKGIALIPSIDSCIRPEIYARLKQHLDSGHTVIIVSASAKNWIHPWAEKEGIAIVLSTEIEVSKAGKLTGRFATPNCYGKEKANRILEKFPERTTYKLIAYGDSSGDTEMLQLADESHFIS